MSLCKTLTIQRIDTPSKLFLSPSTKDSSLKGKNFHQEGANPYLLEQTPFQMGIAVHTSREHAFIILTPLKPYFYIERLGFTGVYIIFLISAQKHRLWGTR